MTTVAVGIGTMVGLGRAAWRSPVVGRARALHPRRRVALPARLDAWLAGALARADVDLAPDDAVRLVLVAALAAGVLGLALSPALAIVAGSAVVAGGPLGLLVARGRADRQVAAALPGALDRIAAGLRSGTTVGEAVAGLAASGGPLGPDLRRLEVRTRLGVGLPDALARWPVERPVAGVRATAGALALAATVGGACASALEALGGSLRSRESVRREAHALTAQARVSALVVGTAPIGYLLFASLADPGSTRVLLGTGVGRVCLLLGLALEAAAALWMRVLLRTDA